MRRVFVLGLVCLSSALISTCPTLLAPAAALEPSATEPVTTAAIKPPDLPSVGEETSLEALTSPDRFGWPARFTCHFDTSQREPLVVVGVSFEDLNDQLLALDVFLEDCRGGFSLDSVEPQENKLDQITGGPAGRDT